MRNDDIIFIVNAYRTLKSKNVEINLPASVAWKRRLNIKELIKANETIHEALQEISDRYSDDEHSDKKTVTNPDGTEKETRVVKPEYINEFLEAQNGVVLQETDVTIRKVKIEELGDIELSDEMLDTIDFMIEEN